MSDDPRTIAIARAICRETCAFKGDPPCFEVEADDEGELPWPPPLCDEPGCMALAEAVAALPVTP